jgi:hypothetical protein
MVLEEGAEDVLRKELARLALDGQRLPQGIAVKVIVPLLQEERHPSDLALGEQETKFWMAIEHAREDEIEQCVRRIQRLGVHGVLEAFDASDPCPFGEKRRVEALFVVKIPAGGFVRAIAGKRDRMGRSANFRKGRRFMTKKTKIRWSKGPRGHDYPAAESYLTLLLDSQVAKHKVEELADAEIATFAAKDIFRASELPLLGAGDSHVKKESDLVVKGQKLSPLLLMRDPQRGKLVIADGYHRLCAVYMFDEDAMIPCKII